MSDIRRPTTTAQAAQPAPATEPPPRFNWRALLRVHPAAELFPPLSEAELKELAADIRENGLRVSIVSWASDGGDGPVLIDGRNRLDALAMLGLLYQTDDHAVGLKACGERWPGGRIPLQHLVGGDPYALVCSLNVHRRHLTPEQKNELIDKLIKAHPEKSNRQIADQAKVGHPRIARRRKQLEANGDVEQRSTSTDTKGRQQPATKPKLVQPPPAEATAENGASAASKSRHKAVAADDIALSEFTSHVLRLLQMTNKAKPERFAKTGAQASDLSQLSGFLADVAGAVKAAS